MCQPEERRQSGLGYRISFVLL
uniref:Uncharacterized protein n=1 Tax=Moniliophthora roreri TaxID=221103 RepID=A0A0W0FTC6_MONRR